MKMFKKKEFKPKHFNKGTFELELLIGIIIIAFISINVNFGGIDEMKQCQKKYNHICNSYELSKYDK